MKSFTVLVQILMDVLFAVSVDNESSKKLNTQKQSYKTQAVITKILKNKTAKILNFYHLKNYFPQKFV